MTEKLGPYVEIRVRKYAEDGMVMAFGSFLPESESWHHIPQQELMQELLRLGVRDLRG